LFQANLSYAVADRYVTNHDAAIPPPAVEGPGGLYFADQGVLTAFALPGGEVRWRLTTIGVTKLQFDSAGALYVDSSTASPQDIQYSDQITFDRAKPVLIKMDPQNGKILWQQEGVGYDCYISGKFLYATTANVGGMAIAGALGEALGNVPQSDEPTRFHLYRLNPATGQTMWDVYHLGAPQAVSFQENKFVLCYDHDVQVWRSLSF
jgi:outer membrane protein assembly factor BamB